MNYPALKGGASCFIAKTRTTDRLCSGLGSTGIPACSTPTIDKFRSVGEKPGVIVIDYSLPDMDGLEVMNNIRALRPATKIVVISGDDTVRQVAIDAGATAFLKKPADIKMITETITALMNG